MAIDDATGKGGQVLLRDGEKEGSERSARGQPLYRVYNIGNKTTYSPISSVR